MSTKYQALILLAALVSSTAHADSLDDFLGDDDEDDRPRSGSYWQPDGAAEYYRSRQTYGLDSAPVVVVPAAPGLSVNPISGTTFLPGGGICYRVGGSVNCY